MGDAAKQYQAYYTVAEWEHWQDAWELISGAPYCMSPAPSIRHQRINGQLFLELKSSLKPCGKCEVFLPIDWQISEDTVVQPDISIVCKEVGGNRIIEAPIAIFEILSPSTEKKDRNVKFELYQENAVKYYIIVNPADDSIEIYLLDEKGKYQKQVDIENFTFDFEVCQIKPDFKSIW
jgi:Uma2 family endonuclease